jgi:predicted dehydrogenase
VYQDGSSDTGRSFSWEINGTKGSLLLEGPSGHIQMFQPTIKFVKVGAGVTELNEIEVDKATGFEYNVGKAWGAVVSGVPGSVVPAFEDALLRHRMIDAIYRSNESGKRESYL